MKHLIAFFAAAVMVSACSTTAETSSTKGTMVRHSAHTHKHGPDCGHQQVTFKGQEAYIHDEHVHGVNGEELGKVHSNHTHRHGPDCGHETVMLGDTVAYNHDGHLHGVFGEELGEVHSTHSHQHGPDCGHEMVEHGDHVDYLHDGHLHAFVDGVWVEHGDASRVVN